MSQALLISNNEVINCLFEVNLRAYVATTITIKPNLSEALDLMEQGPNVDVIIIFKDAVKSREEVLAFIEELHAKEFNLPFILLGDFGKTIKKTIEVKSKYNIKGLLQAMAKILEVTAQEMANRSVSKYFPVPINLLNPIEPMYCDIYLRIKKDDSEYDYKMIVPEASLLGSLQLDYRREGHSHLYIDSTKRLHFINKASAALISELDRDDLSSSETLEITQQGMSMVAESIYENDEISFEVAEVSKSCIKSIKAVIKQVPKLKGLLEMLLENPSDYCYKHSVLATFITKKIISKISWGTDEQQDKVAFSLFFHDIYLVPLYKKYPDAITEEDFLFTEGVTEEEKQIVLDHAKLAGQLIKSFPRCPMGADMIVTQHHGMINGQGFAVSFKDDISPLAKIMIVAEDIATTILVESRDSEKIKIETKRICAQLIEKYRNHTYKKVIIAFEEAML